MFPALIAFAVLAVVPAALAGPAVVTKATDQCACDAYAPVPLYRAYNAQAVDHFYTRSLSEVNNAGTIGWAREGDAGRVLATNATGAVPLYRLWNPTVADHFYTVSAAERASVLQGGGWRDEGVAAYILAQPACGTIPFYRTFQAAHFDHFYTTDAGEMANAVTQLGYSFESVLGYIWPNA